MTLDKFKEAQRIIEQIEKAEEAIEELKGVKILQLRWLPTSELEIEIKEKIHLHLVQTRFWLNQQFAAL